MKREITVFQKGKECHFLAAYTRRATIGWIRIFSHRYRNIPSRDSIKRAREKSLALFIFLGQFFNDLFRWSGIAHGIKMQHWRTKFNQFLTLLHKPFFTYLPHISIGFT